MEKITIDWAEVFEELGWDIAEIEKILEASKQAKEGVDCSSKAN